MSFVIFMVLIILASIIICHVLAKKRGSNPVFWGTMGLLFGPLAIPFVFLSKRRVDKASK